MYNKQNHIKVRMVVSMDKNSKNEKTDLLTGSSKKKNKKVEKKPFPVFTVFCIVAGLLLVAIIGTNIYKSTAGDKRGKVIMTVGDTSINAVEFQYFFQSVYNQYYQYLSYFGVDTSSSSFLDEKSTMDASQTWREYFTDTALKELKQTLLLYNAAKENGLQLEDSDKNQITTQLQTYEGYASQNKVSIGTMLTNIFGRGFAKSDFENMMSIALLADKMRAQKVDSFTYTDEQLEAYYNDNKSAYDVYTYLLTSFAYETPTDDASTPDVDESQDTSSKDAAKAKAEAFLAKVQGKTQQEFLAIAQAEDESFTAESITKTDVTMNSIAVTEVSNWLKEGRNVGDTAVLENVSAYYVPYFIDAHRDNYKTVNLRIITVDAEDVEDDTDTQAKSDATAAAKTKAEEIYTKWQENGANEEAFKNLVSENSDDSTTKSNGGLLNEVGKLTYASTYGSEFDSFAFDINRKEGDCQVITTSSGAAVVYFVSYGEEYWKINSRSGLKNKDFTAYVNELENQYKDGYYENKDEAINSSKK